jgi:hypothetical protein
MLRQRKRTICFESEHKQVKKIRATSANRQPGLVSGKQQIATSNQQPATSNQQPATSNQQPATSNQQPATSNQQPISTATSKQQTQ